MNVKSQQYQHATYTLEHIITQCRGAGVLRARPQAGSAKTVFVLHGLQSCKEHSLNSIYRLAQAGFDAVGVDLYLHGERPEAVQRAERLDTDFVGAMREIIYESAKDIIKIAAELDIDFEQCGMLGISAGGFVGHVLASQTPKMKAYVGAITSPDWVTIDPSATAKAPAMLRSLLQSISPVSHAKNYAPVALLQISALADTMVAPSGSLLLHERLQPIYSSAGLSDRLELITYPDMDHVFTDEILMQAIDWFKRFV